MKSEMKMPRDRDREVKFQKKSREFSRNETLAGYWVVVMLMVVVEVESDDNMVVLEKDNMSQNFRLARSC